MKEQETHTEREREKRQKRTVGVLIIIIEISTAPYLSKILQPKARTKAIQTPITFHTPTRAHTHTHTLSHTSSFKNYMPPKYTYQKAENHTTGASFVLSLSPLAHAQVQVTCSPKGGKVGSAVEHTEKF